MSKNKYTIFKNIIILLITQVLWAQGHYDFAIYHDGNVGAWEDGIIAFEHFLDWKGLSHHRVTAQMINNIELKDYYTAIYFPGGDADYYNADINASGIQHIRNLILNNGAYIGMCAGAEFASDKLVWQGIVIDYPLDLFMGESIGPIDQLAVWPNYAMTDLTMNLQDEINQFEPNHESMLYWGGSYFNAYSGTNMDIVATFDGYNNMPAIIKFRYGNGRVLLISPHPEIEEDSTNDGVNVAEELNDNGTDWYFLWTATDWLLGNPISHPALLSLQESSGSLYSNHSFRIYPNPATNKLNLLFDDFKSIKNLIIYNQWGQEVLEKNIPIKVLNLTNYPSGMYMIEIQTGNRFLRKNFLIIK